MDQTQAIEPQTQQAPAPQASPGAPAPAQDDLMNRITALSSSAGTPGGGESTDTNSSAPPAPPVTLSTGPGQPMAPQQGNAPTMPPEAEATSAAAQAQQTPNSDLMDRITDVSRNQDPNSPGFWQRAGETSGATGLVKGVAGAVSNAVTRPVDLYNQAVKAAQQGDWQTASELSSKLILSASTLGIVDPKNPLLEAARAMILHPVEELKGKAEDARKALATAAGSKEELSNLIADHEAGNNIGAVGDVIGSATGNPLVADVPMLGPMAKQMGANLDKDFHDHNFAAVAGDLLGPIMTMGFGKVLGKAGDLMGDVAGGIDSAKAGTTEVAGVKIPQAKSSPGLARVDPNAPAPAPGYAAVPKFGKAVTRISNLASEDAAKKFVNEQATPAAVNAANANFTQSALESVDDLRNVRGQPTATSTAPPLKTMDEVAKFMKDEAKQTYQVLDDASQKDVDAWDARYGVWDDPAKMGAPPRPKLFTALQDQLSDAQDTMKSKFASQVDKSAAKAELPGYYQEMRDLLTKYQGLVNTNELQAANKVYAQSRRYDWIADKLRTGVKGTGTGTTTIASAPKVNASFYENLPDAYDNKFGTDANPKAFEQLLGPSGMKNYNEVVQALQQPTTGAGGLMGWLNKLPFKLNGVAKVIPINQIADNLLFNPKAGQSMLSLYNIAKNVSNVAHGASTVAKTAPVTGPTVNPTPSIKKAYQGAKGLAQ